MFYNVVAGVHALRCSELTPFHGLWCWFGKKMIYRYMQSGIYNLNQYAYMKIAF